MKCLLCFSSLHMNTYTQSSRIYTQTDENLVLLKAINHPDDLLSVPECSFYISSERTEQQGTHRMVYVQTSAPGAAQHVLPRNTENAENIHVTYAELNRAHTAAEKVQVCLWGDGRIWRERWGAWQRLRWRDAVASYQRRTTLTQFREKHLFQTTYCTHPSRLLCIPGVPYRGTFSLPSPDWCL